MALARRRTEPPRPIRKLVWLKGEAGKDAAGHRIIGKKREAELKKAVRNYERRTKAKIKKYFGDINTDTIAKFQRMHGNSRMAIFSVDLSSIRSVRDFNKIIDYLNRDKTREYKQALASDRRSWLTKTLEHAYDLDRDSAPKLFAAVERMSADAIMTWAVTNPDMVQDLFYKYEEVWDSQTHKEWVRTINNLIDTLQPYSAIRIPYVE